jgi:hypothetical protein
MSVNVGLIRAWLFRLLIIALCGLIIWAFTKPWWIGGIESYYGITGTVKIYGWGIPHTGGAVGNEIADDITPLWQTRLAWSFVGISCVTAFASTFLKGLRGQLLLGAVGAGTAAYALVAAFIVIQGRLSEMGINLQGESYLGGGMGTVVRASLQTGFYVILAGGAGLIILAIMRKLVAGKALGKKS